MEKIDTALILEADTQIANQLEEILSNQFGQVIIALNTHEALNTLAQKRIQMAFVGNPPEGGTCFDLLGGIVRNSPMTYVVLITDEPQNEIHEKAEGYGILGAIPRAFSSNHIHALIDRYREINQVL